MPPIRIRTARVERGRGIGRGRDVREGRNPQYASDTEEDPLYGPLSAPSSPQSPWAQQPAFPGYVTPPDSPPPPPAQPDPALAAIRDLLRQMVQMQHDQSAPRAPELPLRPDYTKTVMLMKNLGTPSFGGSANPIDADRWVESLDRNFAAIRCPTSYKKDIAVYYLERDAMSWWQTVENSYGQDVLDYHIFRQEFERKYFPPEARDRLEIQYLELIQGTGSVREYESEFTRLRKYAARAQQEDEASVIRRFTRGLRPDIRSHLLVVRFYHLTELVERAVNVEESLAAESAARAQMTKPPRSPPRQLSRGQGRDSPRSYDGRRCTRCNRRHTGRCREMPKICYVCGKTGHLGRDCRSATKEAPAVPAHIKCFGCGEPGHYATSCPHRRPTENTFHQRAPALAGSSRPQLPPPPAKRPATAARVFAIDAPIKEDRGKGLLTGE